MNPTPAQPVDADARIDAAYGAVPAMRGCTGECHTSCGPLPTGARERDRIRARHGVDIPVHDPLTVVTDIAGGADTDAYTCPALTDDKRCGIYADRPLICRLWGAVQDMPCPYGCTPDGGYLAPEQAGELMRRVMTADDRGQPAVNPRLNLEQIAELARFKPPTDGMEIDPSTVRDLTSEAIGLDGRLRVMPAAFWANTTVTERALFGQRHGLYSFPTTELVDYLRELIGGRRALEIGAGHGVLAEALGIPATDSHQQNKEPYRSYYRLHRQPTVPYGPNVRDMTAAQAVRRYRPQVVIGCWITHKYDPARHAAGGNEAGVDEADVLRHCETYVHVGNTQVHAAKAINARPHTTTNPAWLFSRAHNGSPDTISTWTGDQHPTQRTHRHATAAPRPGVRPQRGKKAGKRR